MRFHAFAVAMVTLVLGSIGCAASADGGAEPSGATASDLHAGNTVTTKALSGEIKGEENWLDNADGCTFSSKAKDGGLVLTLTADKGTITLDVSADATIKRTEKDDDGSSVEFDIKGVGTIVIIHADDAFDSFALTSDKTHKTTTCEVDF